MNEIISKKKLRRKKGLKEQRRKKKIKKKKKQNKNKQSPGLSRFFVRFPFPRSDSGGGNDSSCQGNLLVVIGLGFERRRTRSTNIIKELNQSEPKLAAKQTAVYAVGDVAASPVKLFDEIHRQFYRDNEIHFGNFSGSTFGFRGLTRLTRVILFSQSCLNFSKYCSQ